MKMPQYHIDWVLNLPISTMNRLMALVFCMIFLSAQCLEYSTEKSVNIKKSEEKEVLNERQISLIGAAVGNAVGSTVTAVGQIASVLIAPLATSLTAPLIGLANGLAGINTVPASSSLTHTRSPLHTNILQSTNEMMNTLMITPVHQYPQIHTYITPANINRVVTIPNYIQDHIMYDEGKILSNNQIQQKYNSLIKKAIEENLKKELTLSKIIKDTNEIKSFHHDGLVDYFKKLNNLGVSIEALEYALEDMKKNGKNTHKNDIKLN